MLPSVITFQVLFLLTLKSLPTLKNHVFFLKIKPLMNFPDKVAPSAFKTAADQKISPSKAGKNKTPPHRAPNRLWNGSSIVI